MIISIFFSDLLILRTEKSSHGRLIFFFADLYLAQTEKPKSNLRL